MDYKIIERDIILEEVQDFNLEEILECGQCFRFEKIDENHYIVIAFHKLLRIQQKSDTVIFYDTTEKDYKNIWFNYFDLARNYKKIKQKLSEIDEILKKSVDYKPGIRLLRQDPWECLISFIISQNKQIPHIKQVIKNISRQFGVKIGSYQDVDYYAFPTLEELSKASEDDIRDCKAGFRAKYIIDACHKIKIKEVDLERVVKISTEEAKKELLKIKGVGNKIADCVLLFALSRYEVFPTDVWVKRIMEYYYLREESKLDVIKEFAINKFGNYAGFAQQYLFYYARANRIGKKE